MKCLEITHVSPSCVVVSGFGARDLVMKMTTRAPVFSSGVGDSPRGWVMQPHRVGDLTAIAEARGWIVVEVPVGAEHPDPGAGRW